MKNLILKKLKQNKNMITVCTTDYDFGQSFCLNLIVELADLDTRMFVENKKNILILDECPDQLSSKVQLLQRRYYPYVDFEDKIFMKSLFEYHDFIIRDSPPPIFKLEKFKRFIEKNLIKVILMTPVCLDTYWDAIFRKFISENDILVIFFDHFDFTLEYLSDERFLIDGFDENHSLLSYKHDQNEIISKIIPDQYFVQLNNKMI